MRISIGGGRAMNLLRATAIALTALAIGAGTPALAQKKSLIVAAATADVGKLDPHQTAQGADKGMLNWMFSALVRIRPGQSSPDFIEPDLAESWTSSASGTEWTFKIRAGVQCHHGYGEFTAEDAAFSLKRAASKETSIFAGDFAVIESVTAADKSTLTIKLKSAIPSLLGLVSNYHGGLMVCKKAAEEMGANFVKKPVGTGPFMFAEYQPQQFVKLAAHKGYFRGAPQLEEITYRFIQSDATRDLAFRSGEVDMMFGQQTDAWAKRMRGTAGVKVVAMEPAELSNLYLNIKAKPLDDLRVRRAILMAIDRKAIAQFLGGEANRVPASVVPIGNLGTAQQELPYDPEQAKKLLAEAGHPNGVTVKSIQSTHPALLRIGQAVQGQLQKVGVKLELETVDHPTYHAQIRKDLSPVTLYQAARFPVADVYLTQFFHSRSIVGTPAAIINTSHCAVADKEIEAARVEPDVAKQKAFWAEAQKKIMAEICAVPLVESLVLWAWKDTLDLGYDLVGSLNLVPHVTEKTRFVK
jgi:peptide/nickel transport system substrate-binding protein